MPNKLNLPWLRLLGLIVSALFLLAGCARPHNWEAALLLSDISAGAESSWLKASTPAPTRQTIKYTIANRAYTGDVYSSPDGVLGGLVMVPGAAEEGKDDPRLVAFATSLARARFAVLVPELKSLRELKVNSGNILEVADCLRYLASQEAFAPHGRVGLVAFSYASGPALLAASRPELAGQVGFVMTIGGYYSLPDVLTFMTTGAYRVDEIWRYRKPSPYGKWVFVVSNLHHLDDPVDRQLFQAMVARKRIDLEAPVDDLARQLGPQGQDLYRFIINTDRTRVAALLKRLPRGLRDEVVRLNLANKNLKQLEAHLILIHGIDDNIIPYTESITLTEVLPEEQAELYLIDGLVHVDAAPGLIGRWRFWRALVSLLAERERLLKAAPAE